MNALGLRLVSLMLELMEKVWWDMLKVTSMTSYDWTVFLLAKSSRRRRASVQTDLKRVFEQLAPTKAFLDLLVAPATFS